MKNITHFALVAIVIALVPSLAGASLQVNGTLGIVADPNYLGFIDNGVPSNPADEATYINNLKGLLPGAGATLIGTETYNRLNSTVAGPFPNAVVTNAVKDEVPPVNPLVLTSAYQYILAKYGGGGQSGGGSLVWYFADGITGNVTVPSNLPNGGPGVSHVSAYNKLSVVIPEPGTMAVWGLLAVCGLAGWKKRHANA